VKEGGGGGGGGGHGHNDKKRNSLKRSNNGQLQGTPPAFTYNNSEKSRIFPNLWETDHASFVGRWSWNVLIQPSAGGCGQFQITIQAFARNDQGKVRIFGTCEFTTTTVLPTKVTSTSALHSLWDLNTLPHMNCFHSMHSVKGPSNATARKAWSHTSTPAYTFIAHTGTSQ